MMIHLKNLSSAELEQIGNLIGEAYYAEDDAMIQGCFESKEQCLQYFRILTKSCYDSHILYALSERWEGFAAYYTKKKMPTLGVLRMVLRFQRAGLGPALKRMGAMHPGWVETNQKYKKEKDFVEVFMVCVPLEHQGKGYLRKLLEEPFALARSMNCPCIIDTNTELRAAKYQHVGMKVTDHKSYPQHVEMYSLEYRG